MDPSEPPSRLRIRRLKQIPRWLVVIVSIFALLLLLLVIMGLFELLGLNNPIRYQPVTSSDLYATATVIDYESVGQSILFDLYNDFTFLSLS